MPMGELLRLSICDGKPGTCLFDLVWNENYVVIPTSIGSLISSFYQIAREFGDKGGVSSIRLRPCSHKELLANSTFGPSGHFLTEPIPRAHRSRTPPPTIRSASFPSAHSPPLTPRDRTSLSHPFLNLQVNPNAATTPEPTPAPPVPPAQFLRASSLPSFGTPGQPDPNSPSTLALSAETNSPSRPLLVLSNTHLSRAVRSTNILLAEGADSDTPSTPSTPTRAPPNPFGPTTPSTPTDLSHDLLISANTDTPDPDSIIDPPQNELTSPPTSPTLEVAPAYPSSPTLPSRVSRAIGHHKRGVKSASGAFVRITLQRDPTSETVVAVMHKETERSAEFAKKYSTTIMKEFMDEYGIDIAMLRLILDRTPEPQTSEVVERYTQKFKKFTLCAEKIKSMPR